MSNVGKNARPTTLDGRELDSWCNEVDHELGEILNAVTPYGENHSGGKPFDPACIPSPAQREAFIFMLKLLSWANSFTGTLRYDVSADHTDCPEHDEWVLRKIARCKADLVGSTLTDDDKE